LQHGTAIRFLCTVSRRFPPHKTSAIAALSLTAATHGGANTLNCQRVWLKHIMDELAAEFREIQATSH